MPLRSDLLNPIAGANPSGVSLRYDRVYDQIKEARTEEDERAPLGDWQRQIKKADFPLVIKLTGEALATRSKDLQLLAWLTEAHLKRDGITVLPACLQLFLDLQQQYWDTLYPEIEDGDSGLRAMPLEWMAIRAAALVREAPLTQSGFSFYAYRESRAVGYEADANASDSRREAREQALAEGKITGEAFDAAFRTAPKSFYAGIHGALTASAELLVELTAFSDQRYGFDGPSFNRLQAALEEVKQVVSMLLNEKRKAEPDLVTAAVAKAAVSEDPPAGLEELSAQAPATPATDAGRAPTPEQASQSAQPLSLTEEKTHSVPPSGWDDAAQQIQSCARFAADQDASNPVAYLLQTGLRWGELRAHGDAEDAEFAVPPATEIRQQLKRLLNENEWSQLLSAALEAAGQPCGRIWLDVHRCIWKASLELGYAALATTAVSSMAAILHDFPTLAQWTFSDDTPVANAETLRWLNEVVLPKPPEPEAARDRWEPPRADLASEIKPLDESGQQAPPAADARQTARALLEQGRAPDAIRLLMRDAAQQESGRARFQSRTHLAELCCTAGYRDIAIPILEQLTREMEARSLEDWEAGDLLAPPLALLLQCMSDNGSDPRRQEIFTRLCRIDPTSAMHSN